METCWLVVPRPMDRASERRWHATTGIASWPDGLAKRAEDIFDRVQTDAAHKMNRVRSFHLGHLHLPPRRACPFMSPSDNADLIASFAAAKHVAMRAKVWRRTAKTIPW